MINLELTDNEAVTLRNLIDVAVRAEGMRAAEFALFLDRKILQAASVAASHPVVSQAANGGVPAEPAVLPPVDVQIKAARGKEHPK